MASAELCWMLYPVLVDVVLVDVVLVDVVLVDVVSWNWYMLIPP
jgi:hypothetical protein